MPKSTTQGPSLVQLKKFLDRQDPPALGSKYIPAILATREEAPSAGRFARFFDQRLGRDVHFLSRQEQKVGLILLYCPYLFDLQEQRLIHFDIRPHPLEGHPQAGNSRFPPLRGACEVAESLGLLNHYPKIRGSADGVAYTLPYVFIGDLLGFFSGPQGPFCVNLNIKQKREDFCNPTSLAPMARDLQSAKERVIARHRIEQVRYAEAGIKTVEIAADEQIHDSLFANIRSVFIWQKRRCSLPDELRREVIDAFRLGVLAGLSAMEVIRRLKERNSSLDVEQLKCVFFHAIWQRQLRLDFFRPILIDEPMLPQQRDLLDVYSDWFSCK